MIRFIDIHKGFGDRKVLDGVSLDVAEGQVLYIVGTSGAGKSVLVKHLIGLIRPDAGRILLGGVDVTWLSERELAPVRKKCAMVFQHATLLDAMSVVDNVALPIRKHLRLKPTEARAMALGKLDLVGMRPAADQLPGELGDGLKKRVAIARARTLDPLAAAQVDALIKRLRAEAGVTAVVVSHDLRSIFSVADRVAMLYEGKVRFDGPPAAVHTSEDPVIRQFFSGDPDGPMTTT